MTPSNPAAPGVAPAGGPPSAPPASTGPAEPTHGCARCGAPVPMGVGLCERCNPLGLRDVSASQVHGTVIISVLIGFVLLAIVARFAVTGLGPFPATLDRVVVDGAALRLTLTVTNEGSASGQTTCRVTTASNQGGAPNAFVLTPELQPGQRITFDQVVTELGTSDTNLVVECRTP